MVHGLLTGFGLAAASSFNAYVPLLTAGLLARYTDLLHLHAPYDKLTHPVVLVVLAVVAVVVLVAAFFPNGSSQLNGPAQAIGAALPDYTLPAVSGPPIDLRSLRGHGVLLNVWATWCGPCRREMPALERLARATRGRLTVVAIDQGEDPATVKSFAARFGVGLVRAMDMGEYTPTPLRQFGAACSILAESGLTHQRPDFGFRTTRVGNEEVGVTEESRLETPFGTLLRFRKDTELVQPRVLVVGDVILDRYVWGDAERISQEAPVILLHADKREERLGGASSVVTANAIQ